MNTPIGLAPEKLGAQATFDAELVQLVHSFANCGGAVGLWAKDAQASFEDVPATRIDLTRQVLGGGGAARIVAKISVPHALASDLGEGPLSPLGSAILQSLVGKAVEARSLAKDRGLPGWQNGEIIGGLPSAEAPNILAGEPAGRAALSAALAAAVQVAGPRWAKDRFAARPAEPAMDMETFAIREKVLDARPLARTPEMEAAFNLFSKMDASGAKLDPLQSALARVAALKACGLDKMALDDGSAETQPAWRAFRAMLRDARADFSIPATYLPAPDGSDDASPLRRFLGASPSTLFSKMPGAPKLSGRASNFKYCWTEGSNMLGAPTTVFDNPAEAARWVLENDKSGGGIRQPHPNFLRTPEGDMVNANHGKLGSWCKELLARIESMEMEIQLELSGANAGKPGKPASSL